MSRAFASLSLCLVAAGCGSVPDSKAARAPADKAPETAPSPGTSEPGIEHFHRWSAHLAQGGEPKGEEGLATLEAMGFQTIVSVDGASPDVAGAARHGLRYVHVPIGYDGLSADEQARMVKAVRESTGPVFVHCHHGLHRGPAAAAIARIATEGITPQAAHDGLKESGCSPDYAGLYRDVLAFRMPDEAVLAALPSLPSVVRPQGIRAAMVEIDEGWDLVKACKEAGWKTPAAAPDVVPLHEATIMKERLREVGRQDAARAHGKDFLEHLDSAEQQAESLETALRVPDTAAANAAFAGLKASCAACHAIYRDRD